MEFGLTEEQQMLKETVRRFAKSKLAPLAYEIDRDERFPSENYKKMAEMGLLGTTIPEEYGGSGGTYMDLMIVIEEFFLLNSNRDVLRSILGITKNLLI